MFVEVEQSIVTRLEQTIPAPARVFRAADLAAIEEQAQFTPAVHVVLAGYTPTQEAGGGAIQEIETHWFVVVAVRNASGDTATHNDADPLLDAVFNALAGWRPTNAKPLRLAAGPQPMYEAGFAYYPLVFTTRQTLRSGAA